MDAKLLNIQRLIQEKEKGLSTLRIQLANKNNFSKIEKLQIEQQLIALNSEAHLLRKQFARNIAVQNLHEVTPLTKTSNNIKTIYSDEKIDIFDALEGGNIMEAIDFLKVLLTKEDDINNIFLIKAQYVIINRKFLEGLISYEQLKTETNRIIMFIISTVPKK